MWLEAPATYFRSILAGYFAATILEADSGVKAGACCYLFPIDGNVPMLEESEVASLMSRPDLPRIAESIDSQLRDEQRRREAFRDGLTPAGKAEFIAGEVIMHSPAKTHELTEGEIESVVEYGFQIPVVAVFDAKQNQLALERILRPTQN